MIIVYYYWQNSDSNFISYGKLKGENIWIGTKSGSDLFLTFPE